MATESRDIDTALLNSVQEWIATDIEPDDQDELRALLDAAAADDDDSRHARAELTDRFAGSLEFGTAGLRGAMAAGPNRMNRAVVVRAAAGLGAYLREVLAQEKRPPLVVVGYDARHRSEQFALDTAAVLTAAGIEVRLLPSALPTPILAFAVRHLGADAGVTVTASHNPPADNGYKVYLGGRVVTDAGQGAQIVPPYDIHIAAHIDAAAGARHIPRAASGWQVLDAGIVTDYITTVLAARDDEPRELRIVTTALHGVGGATLTQVLADAGFTDVTPVSEQLAPDADFPTVSFPNPEEPGAIDLAVASAHRIAADLVIANDPDADRCAVAVPDPRADTATGWRMLHGDEVGALLGEETAQRLRDEESRPDQATLACSIVSSRLVSRIAQHHGLAAAQTLTGFKWIARTPGLVFGYEEALGYCIDPQAVRDKDGISAALAVAQLANRLKAQGRTIIDALDDLARIHGLHLSDQVSARFGDLAQIGATMTRLREAPPTTLDGADVVESTDLMDGIDGLPPTDGLRLVTATGTRVIVRPSGTEPKVKCYLEVIVPVSPTADEDELTRARQLAREQLDRLADEMGGILGL